MRALQDPRGASLTGDGPEGHDRPAGPAKPAEPGELAGPDEAAGHADSGQPAGPADPVDPGQPADPVDPVDPGQPADPVPARPRRTSLLLAVASVVLALDLATKVLVVAELEGQRVVRLLGGALLLSVSRNPGAAFSLGQDATVLFTLVAVTVVLVILRTAPRARSAAWALALGLLLGGASGNLVDRLFRAPGFGRGAVVDFIDFRVWPVFNLADSAIVVGGALAVLLSLRGVELDGTRAGPAERAAPDSSPASGTMEA